MAKRKRKQQTNVQAARIIGLPVATPNTGNARVLATILDWVLGGICSGLPAVIIYALLSGKSQPMTNLYIFSAAGISRQTTIATAGLCLLFAFFYYVIVPWKIFPGQTLGKKMMHVQIVRRDNQPLDLSLLVARQFGFLICIEGLTTAASTYVKVFATLTSRFYVDGYFTAVWLVLTVISIILVFFQKKHLALHDWALGTMVTTKPASK